jgi:hypothetical protein
MSRQSRNLPFCLTVFGARVVLELSIVDDPRHHAASRFRWDSSERYCGRIRVQAYSGRGSAGNCGGSGTLGHFSKVRVGQFWQAPKSIPFYNDFSQSQYAGKPLTVGENESQNWVQNHQHLQATYLTWLLADFHSNMFPLMKAYRYFNSIGPAGTGFWVARTGRETKDSRIHRVGYEPRILSSPKSRNLRGRRSERRQLLGRGADARLNRSIFRQPLAMPTTHATILPLARSLTRGRDDECHAQRRGCSAILVWPFADQRPDSVRNASGPATMVIVHTAAASLPFSVTIQQAGAALFTIGNNRAAAIDASDGSVNGPAHPPARWKCI